jgi:hypothetical protein
MAAFHSGSNFFQTLAYKKCWAAFVARWWSLAESRATGSSADAFLKRWCARLREQQLEPRTGLLIQAASALTGRSVDAPRGSGSVLGAYFVSFADPGLARDLHRRRAP